MAADGVDDSIHIFTGHTGEPCYSHFQAYLFLYASYFTLNAYKLLLIPVGLQGCTT